MNRLCVELLEPRCLPAVTWTGAANDGQWATAGNWDRGTVPSSTSDVVIPASMTVSHSTGADTVTTLSIGTGGVLQIVGNSTITANAPSGTQVTDNGVIGIGDAGSSGNLYLNASGGSGAVSGSGAIVFGAQASNNFGESNGQTLTISAGILIHGQSGELRLANATANLVNNGTIQDDVAGGTITIDPQGTVTNNGTVAAMNGGTVQINPAAASTIPQANLISRWQADGNANDSVGSNNGTLQGAVTYAAGVAGQAFSFNGSDGSVVVPDSPSLDFTSQFTLSAWINPTPCSRTRARAGSSPKSGAAPGKAVTNSASPRATRRCFFSSTASASRGGPTTLP